MSARYCGTEDLLDLRTPLGRDAQERLLVHQQCPQGHKWHLAVTNDDRVRGETDILLCNCTT